MDKNQDFRIDDESLDDVTGGAIKRVSGEVGPSSFRCFCGKAFTNNTTWKTHIASCKTYKARTNTVFDK